MTINEENLRHLSGARLHRALRLAREIEAAELERRFDLFLGRAFAAVNPGQRFLPNWHIELMCEYLSACSRGEIRRLIVNVPPRSLKSITVSVAWPAWLLGRDPRMRIMAASYAMMLSLKHSLDCRLVMGAPWYRRAFPATRLARDQNEKGRFLTTARGFRFATSVGASALGEGGDVLIVDDPHNPRQAVSETERRAGLDWFDQTFSTRLNDKRKGVIVVVMQRLHEDDLTGHLLARGGWVHLALPAVAERREVVSFGRLRKVRAPGELLHAEREGEAEIARAKRELGSYGFAAQYQQRPAPLAGGLVKPRWFRRFREAPAGARIVQSWDTAHKAGLGNDFSVCGTWAEDVTGLYLLDVFRRRLTYPELRRAALSLAAKWRPAAVLIEDAASGQALIQDLRAGSGLPVIALKPAGDKLTRLAAAAPVIEAGRVHLPEHASWLADYEAELAAFPNAAHDDQADMTSQYLTWAERRAARAPRLRRL